VAADTLSRVNLGDCFTINPVVIKAIEDVFGKIYCDRFATATNKVVQRFNSYFFEPGCAGIDAFS
jgi:hypothetical protein